MIFTSSSFLSFLSRGLSIYFLSVINFVFASKFCLWAVVLFIRVA